MEQLHPRHLQVADVRALLADDDRASPGERPWVMANMVASVDGAWAVEGRSGGLACAGDRDVFRTLREICDIVLVAAGTARTEHYRRPGVSDEAARWRTSRGRTPCPRLALISARLEFPADQPFLSGEGPDPMVLHPAGADAERLPRGVEGRSVGTGSSVDLAAALTALGDDGATLVLCEGGPTLLGQLTAEGLIDELFVTISPRLVGGPDVGLLGPTPQPPAGLSLHRVLREEDTLLLTYRRC
jgi:riboflavin biosynthesis pyrimidine reductase